MQGFLCLLEYDMSHFTVTVRVPSEVPIDEVHDEVINLLAPYQENNMGDCPEEFLEFYDVGAEYRPAWESGEETLRRFRDPEGKLHSPYDNEDWGHPSPTNPHSRVYVAPEGWEDVTVPTNVIYPTFDEYMREYHDATQHEDGRYGYLTNAEAKWDWWVIGGRWAGCYPVSEDAIRDPAPRFIVGEPGVFGNAPAERTADGIRIEDIDMLTVEQQLDSRLEDFWRRAEAYIERGENDGMFGIRSSLLDLGFVQCLDEPEISDEIRETRTLKKWDRPRADGIMRYDVIDASILSRKSELRPLLRSHLHPLRSFAALDPVHGWLSSGEMGWFGSSSGTPESTVTYAQQFLDWFTGGDSRDWVVIVDCHI